MKKILIIDDDSQMRELIKDTLKTKDLEIKEAESIQEVIDILPEFYPDLLLQDLRMPNIDGFMILRTIHKYSLNHNCKFPKTLIVSAYIDEAETVTKLENVPVTGYIKKPFDINSLRNKVKNALR